MFGQDELNRAVSLLNHILKKDSDSALSSAKELCELCFGKSFAREVENNGVLRHRSLTGPEDNIQYFGILYENAPLSGIYENFSLVLFPDNSDNPTQLLLCYGIGTGGITDDAELLAVPWVQRSIKLLLKFIQNEKWNVEDTITFVKDNLTDEFSSIPDTIRVSLGNFARYDGLWKKYGKYLPSVCVIDVNENGARTFLSHLILYAKIRNWPLLTNFERFWQNNLFPKIMSVWRDYPTVEKLSNYLLERKYLILQGPPGTGKTYYAEKIAENLKSQSNIGGYDIIQFHPSTSYEDFVEGIKPDTTANELIFRKYNGPLLEVISKVMDDKGYLLIVDEINRGDLAKILGEAIFLFEPGEERKIKLRSGIEIKMPRNFYLLGTMNTADRTIAILDFAIRRRFAFVNIYPYLEKLENILNEKNANEETKNLAIQYFNVIQEIFFKYASDEELNLQPGHTYFIATSKSELVRRLKYELVPLLKEYLIEGRLSLAKNEILAIIDKIENEN